MANSKSLQLATSIITELYTPKKLEVIAENTPAGYNTDRLLSSFQDLMRMGETAEEIVKCPITSIFGCIVNAARLGVYFSNQEAHIIPRNIKTGANKWEKTATFQLGYQGCLRILNRGGYKVRFDSVHEHDEVEIKSGAFPSVEHSIKLSGERGKLIATYAVATKDGEIVDVAVRTLDEIQKIKEFVKTKSGLPAVWQNWESEMSRKTAIPKLLKQLRSSMDNDPISEDKEEVNYLDVMEATEQPALQEQKALPSVESEEAKPKRRKKVVEQEKPHQPYHQQEPEWQEPEVKTAQDTGMGIPNDDPFADSQGDF